MDAEVLATDVYDWFERGEETLVNTLDLEVVYTRVQFSVIMKTLVNLNVNFQIVILIGKVLMKTKVSMRLGL